jgi:hypothetical protein
MNKRIKMGLGVAALASTLSAGVFIGQALADQPHMRAALDALLTAKSELEVATRNKGGHRIEALRLTNEAIRETQLGIEAGGE